MIQGQSARNCMALQAITNAVNKHSGLVISKQTAQRGVTLAKHILKHKLALITDEATSLPRSTAKILSREDFIQQRDKVSKILTQQKLSAREIKQHRRSIGENTAEGAALVIASLASNGLGDVVHGPNKALSLKRKAYSELDPTAQELINELNIDLAMYERLVLNDNSKPSSSKRSKK